MWIVVGSKLVVTLSFASYKLLASTSSDNDREYLLSNEPAGTKHFLHVFIRWMGNQDFVHGIEGPVSMHSTKMATGNSLVSRLNHRMDELLLKREFPHWNPPHRRFHYLKKSSNSMRSVTGTVPSIVMAETTSDNTITTQSAMIRDHDNNRKQQSSHSQSKANSTREAPNHLTEERCNAMVLFLCFCSPLYRVGDLHPSRRVLKFQVVKPPMGRISDSEFSL